MRVGMVTSQVESILKDRLVRGFGAFGLGELFIRVSRIATTVVLARWLDSAELGLAATAIACFEITRVLAHNGMGQMIVRASEERLAATCNSAYRVAWAICLAMALVQAGAGYAIAHYSGRPELLWLTCYLCGVYVLMPAGAVHYWLLQRRYEMGKLSAINAVQVGADNILTAGLAVLGLGAWAIALPKLITAPVWLIGMRRAISWRRDKAAGFVPLREIVAFSSPLLASELMAVVRLNIDKMIVGAMLGIEALGVYYFAFSAGYGLSMVLTSALAAASFAHLADHRSSPELLIQRFDKALWRLGVPISLLIVLQSLAVFIYVPVLFGAKWDAFTPVVAILCLSAASKPWADLATQLLRAAGQPGRELKSAVLFSLVSLAALAAGLTQGLTFGVMALAASTILSQLLLVVWARRTVVSALQPRAAETGLRYNSTSAVQA